MMNGSADGNNNSFNPDGAGRGFGYSKARGGGFRGGGSGGGGGDGPFGGNRNEDMSCFELDKLHIQQIEPSTTEDEFAAFVASTTGAKPESTKFVHRDGVDWWFCFQKFSSEEDAKTALDMLKQRNYKGMLLHVMYSRKKDTMRKHREKMRGGGGGGHNKQQQQSSSSYQDYYQDQPISPGSSYLNNQSSYSNTTNFRGGARGGGGHSNYAYGGRGGLSSSRRGGNNAAFGQRQPYVSDAESGSVTRPFAKIGRGGSGNFSGRNNFKNGPSPNVQARLGAPVPEDTPVRPIKEEPKTKPERRKHAKPTTAKVTSQHFRISDLKMVDVRKPFNAKCLKINSHKDLILQVTKVNSGEEEVFSEEHDYKMHQFFNEQGLNAKRLVTVTPGSVCLAKVEGDDKEMVFRRAVITYCPSKPEPSESPDISLDSLVLSPEVTIELIDVGESMSVEVSQLYSISEECVNNYPVTLMHGCFSHIQVDSDQYDSMIEVLNEFLVADEKAEHEILYSVFRKVYNRVDIEVHLEADETLTKVLYESNDVLMTEASLAWKRYPHISPVYVKPNVQYSGKITNVVSPVEIYVQVQNASPIAATEERDQLLFPTTGSSVGDRVPSRVELDCENIKRDQVSSILFDTMPGYDMPEIPYYTPFPFELVCLCTEENGWCRANIIQFSKGNSNTLSLTSSPSNTPTATADVFLVDSGVTLRNIKIDRLKPLPREFALTTDVTSPTSDISISDPTSTVIPAQAVKLSLPGKLVEPFDNETNEELKSHAMGNEVKFTVVSLPPKYSDEPIRCLVQLNQEDAGEGCGELNMDLASYCQSKGLLKEVSNPNIPSAVASKSGELGGVTGTGMSDVSCSSITTGNFNPNDASTAIRIKQEPIEGDATLLLSTTDSGSGDTGATDRRGSVDNKGGIASNGSGGGGTGDAGFDGDSSVQMSNEITYDIDLDNMTNVDAAVTEEVMELRQRVEQLEQQLSEVSEQLEEMQEFKRSVANQMAKLKNVFASITG